MLAARRMMAAPTLLDREGCDGAADGWVMASPMTIGRRISGVWTYESVSYPNFIGLGLADAYSVETVVTVQPAGTNKFCDWWCARTEANATTGVLMETDNISMTLYLFRRGSVALSSLLPAVPVVGDDIQIVVDFLAKTATVMTNGVTTATLNFSGEPWFTPDGSNV